MRNVFIFVDFLIWVFINFPGLGLLKASFAVSDFLCLVV